MLTPQSAESYGGGRPGGGSSTRRLGRAVLQPLPQLGRPPLATTAADRDLERPPLAEQDHQALAAGDAGVEQVALEHRVVLRAQGEDHGGVLAALGLVDGGGVGEHTWSSSPKS